MITVKKDGSADYTKIQDALDAVDTSSPAIVEVQDSETYSELILIPSDTDLRAATGQKPTIAFPHSEYGVDDWEYTTGPMVSFDGSSSSTIAGFNIDNARSLVIPDFGGIIKHQRAGSVVLIGSGDGNTVKSCSIYNSHIASLQTIYPYHGAAGGDYQTIGFKSGNSNTTFQNNEVYAINNGINAYQATGLKIIGNLFRDLYQYGSVCVVLKGDIAVIGNTFVNVRLPLQAIYSYTTSPTPPKIQNNIIISSPSGNIWNHNFGSSGDVVFAGGGSYYNKSAFSYNCFGSLDIGTAGDPYTTGTPGPGNITADPQFTDAANLDFTLSPSSPCIDAGDDVSGYYTSGINGVPLPAGSGWDMGAFEYADIIKPIITLLGAAGELDPHNIVIIAGDENSPYVYDDNGILTYIDSGATAFDNVDGDITNQIQVSGDIVNVLSPGLYHIYFNVSDAAGNSADTAIRTVQVSQSSAGKVFLRLISLGAN
jgi:hypothetical protein